ncbi:MAG TPA: ATP-binding protein [Flavisolibacter sp.]|jgi:signal transduction histidine kinase|nr:ATP-binding protein [Flavisolibacter sp.]
MNASHSDITLDRQLFDELYGVQPQAITWMKPVWDDKGAAIIDFAFVYSNLEGLNYLNLTQEQHEGLLLSNSPTLTDHLRKIFFEELIHVYLTGEVAKTNIYNPALNKYARIMRTRLRDGVLTVVQERTEENRIIRELEEKTRQLEEQKMLLDNILKNSSNGISVSRVFRDAAGKVVDALTIMANDAAVKYIGFPREIYLTKRATEIEPAVMTSPYYQACIRTLETGEPFVMRYQMQSTGKWLELTVSKLDDDHLIQIFTDVTPIREAELKREQSVEELRRSNESLEEFTRAASHDLKEPIRKIHFFTERLKTAMEGKLSEAEGGLLQRIENASARMNLLVDDLLSYAQLNSGTLIPEEIDLNQKIKTILADLELMISEKGALIELGPLPTVRGYRRQLQQLFQNLLSNAIKYSRPGIKPLVQISSQIVTGAASGMEVLQEDRDKTFYRITVKDNGVGFEQQYADRIFQVFTRLHGNSEYQGTGVGLAIAKKVVDNHGGYISAESAPGEGATFRVLLPMVSSE